MDERRYIAAQGPKEIVGGSSFADFWQMVVEQDVNVIVMVANFTEKNVVSTLSSRSTP